MRYCVVACAVSVVSSIGEVQSAVVKDRILALVSVSACRFSVQILMHRYLMSCALSCGIVL